MINLIKFIPKKYNIEITSLPLRIWDEEWPVPQDLFYVQYKNKVNTSHNTKVVIFNYGLYGFVENKRDFLKRTYGKNNPKKWGKGKKSGRRFDYIIKSNKVFIKILSKCVNLNLKSRKLIFDGNYLRILLKDNEIGVWYISNEGQVRYFILPKYLKPENNFFEVLGILDGEMNKKLRKDRNNQTIKVSNAEPKIIKLLIDIFKKYFLINEKSWRASITINSKNSKILKKDIKKLKLFWSKSTKIPLINFSKTTLSNKYISKNSPKGIIQIRYNNPLFFNILMIILKDMKKKILFNKDYVSSYLRGIAAAEGGIGKTYRRKIDALRVIFISGTNHKEKLFFIECLKKIGIDSYKEYPLRIEIYRKTNFDKLYQIDLFKHNPKRKKNFIKLYKNLSFNNR